MKDCFAYGEGCFERGEYIISPIFESIRTVMTCVRQVIIHDTRLLPLAQGFGPIPNSRMLHTLLLDCSH